MSKIIVTRLAELRIGDRLISNRGRAYRTPLRVTDELGPIEFGSPVIGVRVESPNRPAASSGCCTPRRWTADRWRSSATNPCNPITANSTIRVTTIQEES